MSCKKGDRRIGGNDNLSERLIALTFVFTWTRFVRALVLIERNDHGSKEAGVHVQPSEDILKKPVGGAGRRIKHLLDSQRIVSKAVVDQPAHVSATSTVIVRRLEMRGRKRLESDSLQLRAAQPTQLLQCPDDKPFTNGIRRRKFIGDCANTHKNLVRRMSRLRMQ